MYGCMLFSKEKKKRAFVHFEWIPSNCGKGRWSRAGRLTIDELVIVILQSSSLLAHGGDLSNRFDRVWTGRRSCILFRYGDVNHNAFWCHFSKSTPSEASALSGVSSWNQRRSIPAQKRYCRYSFKNVYIRNILWRSGHSKRAIFCSKLLNDVTVAWWRHYAVSLNFLHVKGPTQKGQFLKYRYVVTKIWVFTPPEGHCQLKFWDIFLFNRMKVFQNIWLVEMRFVKTSLKFRCRIF